MNSKFSKWKQRKITTYLNKPTCRPNIPSSAIIKRLASLKVDKLSSRLEKNK